MVVRGVNGRWIYPLTRGYGFSDKSKIGTSTDDIKLKFYR